MEDTIMKNIQLISRMTEYYTADPKRIQHFIKVYEFSCIIGRLERVDDKTLHILETAAIVHDIGIKAAEQKYGSCNGKLQEKEGPAIAEKMLLELGYEKSVIDRVSYLVGHHHTYSDIDGEDYQILVEADFLVNLYEDGESKKTAENVLNKIFKTEAGKKLLTDMYGLA